jgi:mono/diheme cytochrome c family protein
MTGWLNLISTFAIVALALALPVPGALAQGPDARGRALLQDNCAACHAIGRTGTSPHAAAPPFRKLGASFDLEALERRLRLGIVAGHPDMPEFKFSDDDAHAVAVYLRSIQD